jgi:hypothetical protein
MSYLNGLFFWHKPFLEVWVHFIKCSCLWAEGGERFSERPLGMATPTSKDNHLDQEFCGGHCFVSPSTALEIYFRGCFSSLFSLQSNLAIGNGLSGILL